MVFKTETMFTRTALLNELALRNEYQTYLEIGLSTGENWNAVRVAKKVGVDTMVLPQIRRSVEERCFEMTSDSFFAQHQSIQFDLIFIDGDHHVEQFLIDVTNALARLAPDGTIVCHDCNPLTEAAQTDRYFGGAWNGTVWKGWAHLRRTRADLMMFVIDSDEGLGVIRRGAQQIFVAPETDPFEPKFQFLSKHRKHLLRLIDVEDRVALLPKNVQMLLQHDGSHWNCFGHALLDNAFSLFHRLVDFHIEPQNAIVTLGERQQWYSDHPVFLRGMLAALGLQFVGFRNDRSSSGTEDHGHFFSVSKSGEKVQKALVSLHRALFAARVGDISLQIKIGEEDIEKDVLKDFVASIVCRLGLRDMERDPDLVTIVVRSDGIRQMTNISALQNRISKSRPNAKINVLDLGMIPFAEQVAQMRRTTTLVCTYGSCLANAIFMQPGSRVVVCWPNRDARFIWAGRYCIMHSAILAMGLTVHSVDHESSGSIPSQWSFDDLINTESWAHLAYGLINSNIALSDRMLDRVISCIDGGEDSHAKQLLLQ